METPSSTRRITRSITLSALKNNITNSSKIEESEKPVSKSTKRSGKRKQDRSALIDITNDSPIVGVAVGKLATPSSNIASQRSNKMMMMTPGSGEALLRGQVRSLLQKVEEEAEISKISFEKSVFPRGFSISRSEVLAPTPANTPQISNFSGGICDTHGLDSFGSSFQIINEGDFKISQVLNQIFNVNQESFVESEKSIITRSLLLDFSETSESSDCSSELSFQNQSSTDDDDDDSSELSMKETTVIDDEEELCMAINKMNVKETMSTMFAGKHTRFVYDSDDEIVGEEGA